MATDNVAIELTVPELAITAGLVGLGVAVMQGDEARGMALAKELSNPAVEGLARSVVEKLSVLMSAQTAPVDDVPRIIQ